jgi:hypothetical protein
LQEGEVWAVLMGDLQAETSAVAQFLIDREIEAPERYSAVQSYRVAMAVLRQQRLFVEVRAWLCVLLFVFLVLHRLQHLATMVVSTASAGCVGVCVFGRGGVSLLGPYPEACVGGVKPAVFSWRCCGSSGCLWR